MQRLILAKPKKLSFDKDFRDVISVEEFPDINIAQIIIKSDLFNKLINNKKLSNNDIFDKLNKARLGIIIRSILKELLSSKGLAKKIGIYNLNEVGKNIIQYIKNNLNNNDSDLYKEINLHIYNVFHTKEEEKNKTKIIKSLDDLIDYLEEYRKIKLGDLLIDIFDDATYYFVCYTEEQINKLCETIKSKFLHYYSDGTVYSLELKRFLIKQAKNIFKNYRSIFNQQPWISELVEDLEANDDNIEIELNPDFIDDLQMYGPPITYFVRGAEEIYNRKFYLDRIGVKLIKDTKEKELPVKEVKLDNLKNMTLKQMQQLPTLPSLNNKNDNIGDQENISLQNYYQTKIIISSDGNIKYLPPNNNMQYINELRDKNLNYAIGTITDNGIVCIHDKNNMNINDIVNICKKDSQIKKIYERNDVANFAAKIIRRAKLIWQRNLKKKSDNRMRILNRIAKNISEDIKSVKLSDIKTIDEVVKAIKAAGIVYDLSVVNRIALQLIYKSKTFNNLIANTDIKSYTDFVTQFKKLRFSSIITAVIQQIYKDVANKKVFIYEKGDNITPLARNLGQYIRTNGNILNNIIGYWKKQNKERSTNNTSEQINNTQTKGVEKQKINNISNAGNLTDNIFSKATFKYDNTGEFFTYINGKFKTNNSINDTYPTEESFKKELELFGLRNFNADFKAKNWAYGMRYPDGTLFVVKAESLGVSGYQALKNAASANKVYLVQTKNGDKLQAQRMAKRIL